MSAYEVALLGCGFFLLSYYLRIAYTVYAA